MECICENGDERGEYNIEGALALHYEHRTLDKQHRASLALHQAIELNVAKTCCFDLS